jgi:hypothetical protein
VRHRQERVLSFRGCRIKISGKPIRPACVASQDRQQDAHLVLEYLSGQESFCSFRRSDLGAIPPSQSNSSFNKPMAPFCGTTSHFAVSLFLRIFINQILTGGLRYCM